MRPDDSRDPAPQGDAPNPPTAELQARLGYTFRNQALCETAMTHTSWVNEAVRPERSEARGVAKLARPPGL